jgi:hypothetical protein
MVSSSPDRGAAGSSEAPAGVDAAAADRGTSERIVPELLKRLLEVGVKNLPADAMRQLVGDLRIPKEVIAQTVSQLDETKQGVYRAIGREVHDLLERTNLAEELAKALSLLSLEIKMEVRFKPGHNTKSDEPSVTTEVSVKRSATGSGEKAKNQREKG